MVHDYSFCGSTADFVIKKEHLGFLPDLAISKPEQIKYLEHFMITIIPCKRK
jgi:hypothetical protein